MSTASPVATTPTGRPLTRPATATSASAGIAPLQSRTAFLDRAMASAMPIAGYEVEGLCTVVFPVATQDDRRGFPASAFVGKAAIIYRPGSATVKESRQHVIIATPLSSADPSKEPEFTFVCGNTFLTNQGSQVALNRLMENAISGESLARQAAWKAEMNSARGIFRDPPTANSNHFFDGLNANPESLGCKHVAHFIGTLESASSQGLAGVLDDLVATRNVLMEGKRPLMASPRSLASVPVPAAGADHREVLEADLRKKSPLIREILDVTGPKIQAKLPVILLGEAGNGKTFEARMLGKSGLYDAFYEHPIYPDHDSFDMVGGPKPISVQRPDGSYDRQFIHQDSAAVQAFRSAASGKSTLLLLEELGNGRRDVLNILKNMINPDNGTYEVHTGRASGVVDGIAVPEVIKAPVANLTIVATSNIGADYEANLGDQAVMNRFYQIIVPVEVEQIKAVGAERMKERGFSADSRIYLDRFMDNMVKLKEDESIERLPNKRDLSRIIGVCSDERQVPKMLCRFASQWTGKELDGTPNATQLAMVESAIRTGFSIEDNTWNWKP